MKSKHQKGSCYMCDELATSREHVPPVCLFPEKKDINTHIFRNNLITVPSCDQHNSKKSRDDEFLMECMAGIVGNNLIGFFHTHTKIRRAISRKGKGYLHELIKDMKELVLEGPNGQHFPVLLGRPDMARLRKCFLHIAYGVYFNKYGKKFNGEVSIILDFVKYEDEQAESYKLLCRKRFELEKRKIDEGASPEVFRFQFVEPDEFGLIALRMTFYEGSHVFVAFKREEGKEPFNLLTELIRTGKTITIVFDDGSTYIINSANS